MLNRLIQFSLHHRMLVVACAALLLAYGGYAFLQLPVDVLPDLNRPQVTVFLEANGMGPEEVEQQVTSPVEVALNGAAGVERVRSASSIGIGMVFVEFDWDTEVMAARQLVAERLQTVVLPEGIRPVMGPVSSIMRQVMLIGLTSDTTSAMTLRSLADFTVRRRLMAVKGVSQVIPIGGDRKQYQVHVSMAGLQRHGLSLADVDEALRMANQNSTGGFVERHGNEVLVRNVGRATGLQDLENTVVLNREGKPVLLGEVAEVRLGAGVKRGDASINGKPAVILTVEKQPGASTLAVTEAVEEAVAEIQGSLPPDVKLNTELFQQKGFIVHAISNVEEALRDGFVLVVIILLLFLANLRTTAITLTAIPLSLVVTALVFKAFGVSINTLTLGGLAIAIGELVDDAIVDVENVHRRLRENRAKEHPLPVLEVVYAASSEVRNSIVYATIIVVLVFLPLFFLEGMEGRLFAPLGIAYITSILASLAVSLTVTPALCSYLLGGKEGAQMGLWSRFKRLLGKGTRVQNPSLVHHDDTRLVRWLKKQDRKLLNWALDRPIPVIVVAAVMVVASMAIVPFFGTEFLPAFNEGSFTINVSAAPGTSLAESNRIGRAAELLIMRVPEVKYVSRRTGRAELDEHVEPVSNSEIEVELQEEPGRERTEILADIRSQLSLLKGVTVNIGQPISHRLDHLLSGVRAQVAIKLFGNDLGELRRLAGKAHGLISGIPGVVDAQVEKQVLVPQLQVKVDRQALQRYGMQAGRVVEDLEVLYNGKVEGQIYEGQQAYDVVLRSSEEDRANPTKLGRTMVDVGEGQQVPLEWIASVQDMPTPNSIYHENTLRRIVVSCNVQGRDLGSTVAEIKAVLGRELELPQGYSVSYGGQFERQESASRMILLLSVLSLLGIVIVLYGHFRSGRMVAQVMLNVPLALIGSVVAVLLTGGTFSIATLVGFVTLTGIASRNGIMMLSHYEHLMAHEGERFGKAMIIRGSQERLVPVLMTAMVAGLALIPLTLDASAPWKEILHPVSTVILGGLVSSTLLDMIVTPTVYWVLGRRRAVKLAESGEIPTHS